MESAMKKFGVRNQVHADEGAEIAEAALVLPLAFMILLGVFWFGQAFRIYGTLTHAVREGARAAATPACTTCSGTNDPSHNAFNAVHDVLVAARLDPAKLHRPATMPPLCTCGSSGTSCSGGGVVPCDSGEGKICVQGITRSGSVLDEDFVQLSAPSNGAAGVCGVSVSFQYPYQFWLPFTSLNLQTIQIQAQAQVRVESQ
jgi:hypothetical protein